MSISFVGLQFREFFSKLSLPNIMNGPAAPLSVLSYEPSPMTPLWLVPHHYPTLRLVCYFRVPILAQKAKSYFATRPDVEQLIASLQALTLPLSAPIAMRHPGIDTVFQDFNPFIINNSNDLITLLHRFIFRSVRQILRVLDSSRDWLFTNSNRPWGDNYTSETVANVDPVIIYSSGSLSRSAQLVLLPFTPWEFTEKDFTNLSCCNRVLISRSSDRTTKSDRLLAYLYDICLDLDCHYFAITSYQQWSFGYFTLDYSAINLSYSLSFDCFDVSIIEVLIYWIQRSFKVNQSRSKPPLEPVQIETKKRPADSHNFSPILGVKRRRLNEELLQVADADTWKWVQFPLGPRQYRFGRANNLQRRGRELQRIEDQLRHKEKMKRCQEIRIQARKAKLEKRLRATNPMKETSSVEGMEEAESDEGVNKTREETKIKEQSDSDSDSETNSDTEIFREKKDPKYFNEWITRIEDDAREDTWELNFCVGNPGQFIHPEYVKESAANHVALSDCSESTGSTES